MLNPATVVGQGTDGIFSAAGPGGTAALNGSLSLHEEIGRLVSARVLLLSETPEAAHTLAAHLDSARTSRTAAYLCCLLSSCDLVNQALDTIAQARVLIVGCGGIGATAAVALGGVGVRSLHLCDPDLVEISNLNRQLFWRRADEGRLKVEVLGEVIADRFPDVKIDTCRERLDTIAQLGELIAGKDAMLFTADEPLGIDKVLRDRAGRSSAFMVFAGYTLRGEGVLRWGRQADVYTARTEGPTHWTKAPNGIAPSYGPLNLELAGQATALLVNGLIGDLAEPGWHKQVFDSDAFPRRVWGTHVDEHPIVS
ncbi:ThiF family adenylyltransferase [Aromatoleum sp.]|uniref:HesA/MoeB/ThiF family protein n=1 Tax=Aromatoleum sp. TaxID=2307007 RepID=UPI002B459584|nr:ThiF family adenylyltransferase [Aromatoleum sp.]